MGRKRASMAPGDAPGGEKSSKKSKKRRRESEQGGGGTGGERRTPSSKAVVLRRAAADSVNPLLVSFANQTVPKDMDTIGFRLHEPDDEEREGDKVVIGSGGRWALCVLGSCPAPVGSACVFTLRGGTVAHLGRSKNRLETDG